MPFRTTSTTEPICGPRLKKPGICCSGGNYCRVVDIQNPAVWRAIIWQEHCVGQAMSAVDFSAHVTNPLAAGRVTVAATASPTDEGFSFSDLLDIVNPLQHIPVVSTLY